MASWRRLLPVTLVIWMLVGLWWLWPKGASLEGAITPALTMDPPGTPGSARASPAAVESTARTEVVPAPRAVPAPPAPPGPRRLRIVVNISLGHSILRELLAPACLLAEVLSTETGPGGDGRVVATARLPLLDLPPRAVAELELTDPTVREVLGRIEFRHGPIAAFIGREPLVVAADGSLVPVEFVLRDARFAFGQVRDFLGRPVAGVTVDVRIRGGRSDGGASLRKLRSSATGTFAVPCKPSDSGFAFASLTEVQGRQQDWTAGTEMALLFDTSRCVRVRVLDPDGTPVPECGVQPWRSSGFGDPPSETDLRLVLRASPDGWRWIGQDTIRQGERWFVYTRQQGADVHVFTRDVLAGGSDYVLRLQPRAAR